jgi:hypothetical protein
MNKLPKRLYSSDFENKYLEYKYLKSINKNDIFDIIRNEYIKTLNHDECWHYKGQSDYTWKLETKIERDIKNYPTKGDKNILENNLLREFQRKASINLNKIPNYDNYLEWLSIMRHYGGPNRLLDFTYSFYVALYFAVENMNYSNGNEKKACAIYAINDKLLKLLNLYNDRRFDISELVYDKLMKAEFDSDKTIKDFLLSPKLKVPFVFHLSPFILNERIVVQQGSFLYPWDLNISFEENLQGNFEINKIPKSEYKDYIKKFVIKLTREDRKLIINELHRMNINKATVYPGLEGFSGSLSIRMELN